MNIFFTADLHLSHYNIMQYCDRPFTMVKEMDEIICNNFKADLKKGDTLYLLGDISFNVEAAEKFFDSIPTKQVHYILGNHDRGKVVGLLKERCVTVGWLKDIKIRDLGIKISITLSHYAMRVWHKSHFNSWNLYGHSHGRLKPVGKQMDVGVDCNDFRPVPLNNVLLFMDNQPDNFNFIPPERRRR